MNKRVEEKEDVGKREEEEKRNRNGGGKGRGERKQGQEERADKGVTCL